MPLLLSDMSVMCLDGFLIDFIAFVEGDVTVAHGLEARGPV